MTSFNKPQIIFFTSLLVEKCGCSVQPTHDIQKESKTWIINYFY